MFYKVFCFLLALAIGTSQVGAACRQVSSCNIVNHKQNLVVHQNNRQFVVSQKIVDFNQFYGVNSVLVPASSLGLQYYYSVQGDQDKEELAEKVADKVVEKLSIILQPAPQPAPQPQPEPQPTPEPQPEPQPAPQPEPPPQVVDPKAKYASEPYSKTELHEKVWAIVKVKCLSCHGNEDAAGKFSLAREDFDKLNFRGRSVVWDRVDGSGLPKAKVMPKNSQPLSDSDVKLVRDWMRELQ